MASYFFDSSALAKRYHPGGTEAVDGILNAAGNEICISRLTVVELPKQEIGSDVEAALSEKTTPCLIERSTGNLNEIATA